MRGDGCKRGEKWEMMAILETKVKMEVGKCTDPRRRKRKIRNTEVAFTCFTR